MEEFPWDQVPNEAFKITAEHMNVSPPLEIEAGFHKLFMFKEVTQAVMGSSYKRVDMQVGIMASDLSGLGFTLHRDGSFERKNFDFRDYSQETLKLHTRG